MSASTRSGSTLVVQVDEYSVVNQVLFQGNKKLKDAELAAAVQLKPRGSFSQDALNADVEAIKAAYNRIGRDDTQRDDADHGSRREPGQRRLRDQRRRAHQDRGGQLQRQQRLQRPPPSRSDLDQALVDPVLSSCATTSMPKTGCAPTKKLLRRFYYNHGYADFRVDLVVRRSRPVDQRIRHQFHGRGRRALHLRRRDDREQHRRHHRREPGRLDRDQRRQRLQRQGRRGHDHRLDREGRGHGLCLRAGDAARRPQFREPHDLGRLRDRPGSTYLCRAHRNPRQRAHARLS